MFHLREPRSMNLDTKRGGAEELEGETLKPTGFCSSLSAFLFLEAPPPSSYQKCYNAPTPHLKYNCMGEKRMGRPL